MAWYKVSIKVLAESEEQAIEYAADDIQFRSDNPQYNSAVHIYVEKTSNPEKERRN